MLGALHRTSSTELLAELRNLVSLPEPYIGFLAFDHQGRALGMIDARIRNYAEGAPELKAAYVEDLWVEPQARLSGVGRALLEAVEIWARSEGLGWLGSDTTLDNAQSRAWHAAVGFEEVEEIVVFGKSIPASA
jgi:aminoglycoside 6'-N-acetyltransferase I